MTTTTQTEINANGNCGLDAGDQHVANMATATATATTTNSGTTVNTGLAKGANAMPKSAGGTGVAGTQRGKQMTKKITNEKFQLNALHCVVRHTRYDSAQ